jgi:PAS domain S-box-containing protein
MISFFDTEGRIELVNREWERKRGLSLKDVQELGPDILGHIYPDPKDQQRARDVIAAASGEWSDFRSTGADGQVMDTSWANIRLSDGSRLSIGQDVTERKRAEEALKSTSEQLRALSASLESAREEEGTRIAREIHDELGSALTSLKWDLENFHKVLSESTDQSQLQLLRERIAAMLKLAETTIGTVRRISSELRPNVLDDLGLVAAIEWYGKQFQDRTGIIVQCDCALEKLDLSREQSTAVFRIFQEALTNILRHAQATRVDLQTSEEDGEFILRITDNGRGITVGETSGTQTLGLLGMRERAHLIGGRINITGVAGQGTVVTIRVPDSSLPGPLPRQAMGN